MDACAIFLILESDSISCTSHDTRRGFLQLCNEIEDVRSFLGFTYTMTSVNVAPHVATPHPAEERPFPPPLQQPKPQQRHSLQSPLKERKLNFVASSSELKRACLHSPPPHPSLHELFLLPTLPEETRSYWRPLCTPHALQPTRSSPRPTPCHALTRSCSYNGVHRAFGSSFTPAAWASHPVRRSDCCTTLGLFGTKLFSQAPTSPTGLVSSGVVRYDMSGTVEGGKFHESVAATGLDQDGVVASRSASHPDWPTTLVGGEELHIPIRRRHRYASA